MGRGGKWVGEEGGREVGRGGDNKNVVYSTSHNPLN